MPQSYVYIQEGNESLGFYKSVEAWKTARDEASVVKMMKDQDLFVIYFSLEKREAGKAQILQGSRSKQ